MRTLIAFTLITLLSACAGTQTVAPQGNTAEIKAEQDKQRALAYQGFIDNQTELYRVAFPILTKNAASCEQQVRAITGLSVWNIHSVPSAYQNAVGRQYNLGQDLIVHSVVPGSPAAKAGLKSGDLLLSVNGQPIPRGKNALKVTQDLLDSAGYRNSEVAYIRNNITRTGIIRPVKACNYPVLLDNSSVINAYADGSRIIISRGIMRFAENDNELALVIAHELAHNTMNHIQKLKQNTMTGALGGLAIDALLGAAGVNTGNQFSKIGGAIGQQRFSVPFEQEADYVGMYYMANAGYDTSQVANFWRRMAAEGQASIDHRTSHPTSPERCIAIDRTHSEIRSKKSSGASLAPNFSR